jgi:hypothetical protein
MLADLSFASAERPRAGSEQALVAAGIESRDEHANWTRKPEDGTATSASRVKHSHVGPHPDLPNQLLTSHDRPQVSRDRTASGILRSPDHSHTFERLCHLSRSVA